MDNEQVERASQAVSEALQLLADLTDMHLQHALGFGRFVAYKIYHPKSCREQAPEQLPPANPEDLDAPKTDIPDVFKRLWDDEPKP